MLPGRRLAALQGTIALALVACAAAPSVAPPRPSPHRLEVAAPPEPSAVPDAGPQLERTLVDRQRELDDRVAAALHRETTPAAVGSGDADADLVACRVLASHDDQVRAARSAFEAVAIAYPDDPFVALEVARFRVGVGDASAALRPLDELVADGTEHPDLRWLRGVAHLAAGDAALGELILRNEVAVGEHFADAAARLCEHFVADEQYRDALAVVVAARSRASGRSDLRLLEAGLRFDLWELDRARAELTALVADDPGASAAWLELADVERARQDPVAAQAALERVVDDNGFAVAHRERVAAIDGLLRAPRPTASSRDMFAMLRGLRELPVRAARLRQLLDDPVTRDRAIELAFVQDEPVLRVMAIRALPADALGFESALQVALDDPDPRVRGIAAVRLGELDDPARAVYLARSRLDAEEDPYAFRALHDALTRWLGPTVDLPEGGAADPSIRSKIRQAWRLQ